MEQQHCKIIEKENQAIEKILEIVNTFISDVEKPIKSQNSLDHTNWYKNKLKEWEALKKLVEALKERASILNNKKILELLKF